MRLFGAILLLLFVAALAGCPEPITDEETTNGTTIDRELDASTAGAVVQESDGEADAVDGDGDAVLNDSSKAEADEGEMPADEAEAPVDEDGADTRDAGGAITFPGQDRADDPADQPAEESEEEPQDMLDPAAMLGDAADEPVKEPEPTPPLDAAARAFSGQWAVIVINQDGRSRLAQADGEWVFELADDATCTVSRELNGVASEQSGRWEYGDDELKLRLGPAHREYTVEQPRENVALFTDDVDGAVLFCLRLEPGKRAPMLKANYQLADSELRFRSAGPGGHWRGTLSEPECSLLVRPIGNFVAGSWETPQDKGYVLLELSDDGFDGWWWYSASIEFDGVWVSGEE